MKILSVQRIRHASLTLPYQRRGRTSLDHLAADLKLAIGKEEHARRIVKGKVGANGPNGDGGAVIALGQQHGRA